MENEIKDYIGKAKYDRDGQMIWTKDENHLCDIRGWGHLSTTLGSEQAAIDFQDKIGQFITDAINEKLEREKLSKS